MSITKSKDTKKSLKMAYKKPLVECIEIDTEIALAMVSVPPNPMMPQMPNTPEGIGQRLFKLW